MVIFGGNDGGGCFDSVHVLEATSPIIEGNVSGRRWVWSNPTCGGKGPSPRTGHVATLLSDGTTIMVYGGWDPNTEVVGENEGDDLIYGDSYLLDTKTWMWKVGIRGWWQRESHAERRRRTRGSHGGKGTGGR